MTSLDASSGAGLAAAYGTLAGCYQDAGEQGEAEIFYRRGLVVDPAAVALHVGLAQSLLTLNRPIEAEGHLRRALALDPHSVEAMNDLADLCRVQGRLGEAVRVYRTALQNGAAADTHLGYARVVWELGSLDDAETHLREALRSPDAPADAEATLGLLLAARRRPREAEPHLRAAADALGCSATLVNHGNSLAELGRPREAERRYRQALAIDPDNAAALWGIAELCARAGDREGEQHARARAVELAPELERRCLPAP